MQDVLGKIRRGIKKSPKYIVQRLASETWDQAERYLGPRRAQSFKLHQLLEETGDPNLESLWKRLTNSPFVCPMTAVDPEEYEQICPGDFAKITQKAESALDHRVSLLGSGLVDLGTTIDWHRDYKTNLSWPINYCKDIDYVNLDRPSDVKFPWELSRMQWLIPVAQAFLLTGNERYAGGVREAIEQWIEANPYARGVNWSCTMDVALRAMTWTWFFHAFGKSDAWSNASFQGTFLRSLYLHADFIERHLEESDINGNHFTANAAGLVFCGLFFGRGNAAARWSKLGWKILRNELPKQVHADGVDFEASTAYHRLVLELFYLAALYRIRCGVDVPPFYRDLLGKMAAFTTAYTKPDGLAPLWGDADDARALPFGNQDINDHRYLIGLVGLTFNPELLQHFSGPRSEIFWALGAKSAISLPNTEVPVQPSPSQAFPLGGFYIMRSAQDHVFIDCGPLGLAGRGGHGHNDLLSFEAVLDGVPLISDCGSYVYTADYIERNRFRSTACHNTPMVTGEEINRFVKPEHLWTLRNDAQALVEKFSSDDVCSLFIGSHDGYKRLGLPMIRRTITLDHISHALEIVDEFSPQTEIEISSPLHLSPGITARIGHDKVFLETSGKQFVIAWQSDCFWRVSQEPAWVSPSYGIKKPVVRLVWKARLTEAGRLRLIIRPEAR